MGLPFPEAGVAQTVLRALQELYPLLQCVTGLIGQVQLGWQIPWY